VTLKLVASNVANLYQEPSTSSEVVSQAIAGVPVQTLDDGEEFSFVRTEDRYQGWTPNRHLCDPWDMSDYLCTTIATLFADIYIGPDARSEILTKLVCSSRICLAHGPTVGDFVPIVLADQAQGYVHSGCLDMTHGGAPDLSALVDRNVRRSLDISALKRDIIESVGGNAVNIGRRFIGTPYLWGGTTPFGIDCSGFVQLCYRLSGVQLLRDAHLQYGDSRFHRCDDGDALDCAALHPGDLLAFSKHGDDRITHIGLAAGDSRFLHSSSGRGVAFDHCSEQRYQATFVGAVRLSADADLAIDAA
jgi:hypothetical protein